MFRRFKPSVRAEDQFLLALLLKDLAATQCLQTMPSMPPKGSQTLRLRLDGVHVKGILFHEGIPTVH